MKNLLIIPHFSEIRKLKTRGMELAKALAKYHNVYYILWYEHEEILKYRITQLTLVLIKRLFTPYKIYRHKNLNFIEVPLTPAWLLGFYFNNLFLRKVIKKYHINFVINESLYFDLSREKVPYIYDMVDDYFVSNPNMRSFLKRQASAKVVTVCSSSLKKKLEKFLNRHVIVVPNGVSVNEIGEISGYNVRKKYGLLDKFVIGFIGNFASWSGLIFSIDTFKIVRESVPNATLLIVGWGSLVDEAKNKVKNENISNVLFTGPVEPAMVTSYFKAIDIGVLPFSKTPLTDAAFPIKVLEYSAAKKLVVATPLEELKALNLPNVVLVEPKKERWANAIISLKSKKWNPTWMNKIRNYDWNRIAKVFNALIEEEIGS